MAVDNTNIIIDKLATPNVPIPGQSLTNNPDEPLPFEGPPQFANMQDALDYIFLDLTDPEKTSSLKTILKSGYPVSLLTEQILMVGFTEGLWNPDVMLLLLEPVLYMIIAVGNKLGVEDLVVEPGDVPNQEEMSEEETVAKVKEAKKAVLDKLTGRSEPAGMDPPVASETPESIEEPTQVNKSLLSREEI